MPHVLSFDFGTGGVRAGVFATRARRIIAQAEAPYPTQYPRAGWAEQDPRDWSVALRRAGREAIARAGLDRIDAVCTATTASTVAICARDGTPLRPALLWMDCRAEAESRRTATLSHPVMRFCGGSDAVEWMVPKAMWLRRHQPAIWDRAEVICEAVDYVNFDLTGEWVGSRLTAACKWNYDSLEGRLRPEIYAALGVGELAGRLPPRILPVGAAIGPMRAALAAELGLANRPLVAQGGIDAHMGMLGADIVQPGRMLFIGGTSNVQLFQLAAEADVPGFWGPYPNALTDGHWLVECGQVSAGSILSWLAGTVFGLDAQGHAALIAEVAARPGPAEGLLTLDYWMGNRTPYRDAGLRGAMLGLTLGHGRADLYASAVDAIALGSANILAVLAGRGITFEQVVMAGGIVNNPAWLRASVDALGRPVRVAQEGNLSLLGAAAAGAAALGLFGSLAEAAAAVAAPSAELTPDPARAEWYARALPVYREATEALGPVLHDLARRQGGAG